MTGVVVPLLPFHHRWREHIVLHGGDEIDAYALAVVAALHVHMNAEGVCSVGVRRLAEVARCTVPTVRERLERLERIGLLEVHRNGQSRAVYRAVLPAEQQAGSDGEVCNQTVETVQPDCTPEPDEVCNLTTSAVQPGGTNCASPLHTYTPSNEPLRARVREAPPGRRPGGPPSRRPGGGPVPVRGPAVRSWRDRSSTPPLAAGGPTLNREPVPWQVEERPDGTLWVRRVAS